MRAAVRLAGPVAPELLAELRHSLWNADGVWGRGMGAERAFVRAVVAALVVLLTGTAVAVPVAWPVTAGVVAFLLVVVLLAKGQGNAGLRDAALLSACLWALIRLPVIGIWPLPALGALVVVVLLRGARSTLLRWREWLRVGSISRGDWLLCTVIVVFTAAALITWQQWTGGALPPTYGALLDSVPRPAGIVGILLFLVVNGLVEDSVWSGVLVTASMKTLPAPLAVLITAASFGLAHLHGVPDGPIGVAMVVVWGVVLAVLRLRTRGMLATYLAHILADATIVALLVPTVLQSQ